MAGKILVAYATRNGSTAEIASAIGKELQAAGYDVDVAEMKTVTTLDSYSAVVIGAPVYMGSLVKEAGAFVGRHRNSLIKLPVAAFAVGLAPKNPDPKAVEEVKKALHASLVPLKPVAETVFAGRLDLDKLSFIQRKMAELVKSPVGDFRDWDAIAAWARALSGTLR